MAGRMRLWQPFFPQSDPERPRSFYPGCRKDLRKHLHRIIDHHRLDLHHVTERRGSPHTLVCTKNRASHERRFDEYAEDLRRMDSLLNSAPDREKWMRFGERRRGGWSDAVVERHPQIPGGTAGREAIGARSTKRGTSSSRSSLRGPTRSRPHARSGGQPTESGRRRARSF